MAGVDFTRGNSLGQLIRFSGPIVVANLLQVSFQIIDSFWVGNLLGVYKLGAVAIASIVIFTALSFVLGMNNAVLIILSQLRGLRDDEGLRRYLNASVIVLTLVAVGMGGIGILFTDPVLRLLGTPDELFSGASRYLKITFLGMVFLFGYNFLSTVLRAMGDSRTPLRFMTLGVIVHVVLVPVFIHGLQLGLPGAAIASLISQGIALTYGTVIVTRKRLAPFSVPRMPAREEVTKILSLGFPAGLQIAVVSAGAAAVLSVVTPLGANIVGGFGAAQRLDSLLMLPAQALGIAVSSMAGQNIGVKNWGRVSEITRHGILTVTVVLGIIAAILVWFAEPLTRIFIDEPPAVEFAVTYLRIVAFCYPLLGINFIFLGVIRAAGAMYPALILNIVSLWTVRYPLTFLFTQLWGEPGIPIGLGVSFFLSALFAYLYYRFGTWRKKLLFA